LIFVGLRFLFNYGVLKERAIYSEAAANKQAAYDILKITGSNPVYLHCGSVPSRTTVYYIMLNNKHAVNTNCTPQQGEYIIIDKKHALPVNHEAVYEFQDGFKPRYFCLAKIK
ncbi:MAG: hypothetical protein HC896_03925, partial [Bacteroidales bacterium]|nr:hypothetical protein [Bacteroidales bacterium]